MKFFMTITAILAVLGAIEAISNPKKLFSEFMEKYDRYYETNAEYRMRYKIFVKNLHKIKQLQETEEGTAIYGINKFSDFTDDELSKITDIKVSQDIFNVPKPSRWSQEIPVSFDWREHNAVTEVKNQGSIGRSGVFSAVANIEGQYGFQHGLLSFSEQEVIDCGPSDAVWPFEIYPAIFNIGGLETEMFYPYVDKNETCKVEIRYIVAILNGYRNLTNDESKLAEWLYENGPLSVVVNGNLFKTYVSGIIDNQSCLGGINLNLAVTLVGYGTENNVDYWIVKNSWGADWGEQGYARLARGVDMCGIAEMPTSAIVL